MPPTLVIGGGKDVFYPRELFEETATPVKDGRAHIYPSWGHMRTSTSATTANITLGFMLAARVSCSPEIPNDRRTVWRRHRS